MKKKHISKNRQSLLLKLTAKKLAEVYATAQIASAERAQIKRDVRFLFFFFPRLTELVKPSETKLECSPQKKKKSHERSERVGGDDE